MEKGEDNCLGKEETGSRAQRKDQLCPNTTLPGPGGAHGQLCLSMRALMKSLPAAAKAHIRFHGHCDLTVLHLICICWSHLRVRTGFLAPPLMPITRPGSLTATSLTSLGN